MIFNHQAYIYLGDWSSGLAYLAKNLMTEFGPNYLKQPNVWSKYYDGLTVDDSREIKQIITKRAFRPGRRFVILGFTSANPSALNALLKVLEEPGEETCLILIVPTLQVLLPTVISRCELLSPEIKTVRKPQGAETRLFLASDLKERLVLIDKWKKSSVDSITFKKLARSIILDLEYFLISPTVTEISVLSRVKKYFFTSSFNPRLTLIYLALALPPKFR